MEKPPNYAELKEYLSVEQGKINRTYFLVKKDTFERLWNASTDEQRAVAYDYIKHRLSKALKRWTILHPENDYELWYMKDLIALGSTLRIKNYCRVTRSVLISKIREKQREHR